MKLLLIVPIIFILLLFSSYYSQGIIKSDDNTITIPVTIHIVEDDSGFYTSRRSYSNAIDLINNSNVIWKQAGIEFKIEKSLKTHISFQAIPKAINGNYNELMTHENFHNGSINIFLTRSLNGINGIALVQIDSIMISDFTTVNDYRTVAHELGHVLRLMHVTNEKMLMARGENGELLSPEEINLSRKNALNFVNFRK